MENALTLLQKAHGVLEVVDVTRSPRDAAHALQLFYNMAACYQKLGQLDECSLCLETCLDYLESPRDYSAAFHMHRLRFEIALRLQLCAIFSQLHKHKNALEQAELAVQLSHYLANCAVDLCGLIRKKGASDQKQQFFAPLSESHYHNISTGEPSIVEGQAKMIGRIYGLLAALTNGIDGAPPSPPPDADMRHILGFLNQTEWVGNLNIGNIMQIQPVSFGELNYLRRNE